MKIPQSIFVAGHNGMVGSAVVRELQRTGYTGRVLTRSHAELDLLNQSAVSDFFASQRPECVILAAARVGGILANSTFPSEFLYENVMIEMNVIRSAVASGARKLVFLGSSCIYPKMAPQPIKEESLLTSPLESTNEAYAIAKIVGLKYCQFLRAQHGAQFISLMPTNLYGTHDNFHPDQSHVIPGLLRRFHEAKIRGSSEVVIWGDGTPLREFLHVDELANACLLILSGDMKWDYLNVGSGLELSIAQLAQTIKEVVGFDGKIVFDPTKPNGTPRKRLDTKRISELGWKSSISLEVGLKATYEWAIAHRAFG